MIPPRYRPMANDDLADVEKAMGADLERGCYEIDSPRMRAILQAGDCLGVGRRSGSRDSAQAHRLGSRIRRRGRLRSESAATELLSRNQRAAARRDVLEARGERLSQNEPLDPDGRFESGRRVLRARNVALRGGRANSSSPGFDRLLGLPGASTVDEFGLVQSVDRLGQRRRCLRRSSTLVTCADPADRASSWMHFLRRGGYARSLGRRKGKTRSGFGWPSRRSFRATGQSR